MIWSLAQAHFVKPRFLAAKFGSRCLKIGRLIKSRRRVGADAKAELHIMHKDEKDMEQAMDSSMLHTLGSSMAFGLGFGAIVVLFAHVRKEAGRHRRAQGGSSAATAPSGGGGGGGKAHGRYERSGDEGSSSPESSRLLQSADTRQFPSVTRRKSIDRFEEF